MKKLKAKVLDDVVMNAKTDPCVACGCTDERACPGGCYWYEPGLCSACAIKQNLIKVSKKEIVRCPKCGCVIEGGLVDTGGRGCLGCFRKIQIDAETLI